MATALTSQCIKKTYEKEMRDARRRFLWQEPLHLLLSPFTSRDLMELFLLYFSALNTRLTAPVADYLLLAGNRAEELGYPEAAAFLRNHSVQERGHDCWAADDLERIAAHWNRRRRTARFDPSSLLLVHRNVQEIADLHALHDAVARSHAPYAMIAIGHEIERLSSRWGPALLFQSLLKTGPMLTLRLKFIPRHMHEDRIHHAAGRRFLHSFLEHHPEALEDMARAGSQTLDSYAAFLRECVALAAASHQRVSA